MKREITRIMTIEITDICTVEESDLDAALSSKDTLAGVVKKELREFLHVDDATLVSVQDFVRDVKEAGDDDGEMAGE